MAELLAANQITIAKVLDGENGGDGYSPTVTTGTSSDGSTTVTVTNKDGSTTTVLVDGTARADIDTLSDKTRSGYIETLSGSGFVQSTKTEDGGASEVTVYGKSVQDGTPWIGTEVDSVPYLNRAMPSQSNDYNMESLKIVGGTVAWNQRASVRTDGTERTATQFGITAVAKNDGSVVLNGTATQNIWLSQFLDYAPFVTATNFNGHAVLVDYNAQNPTSYSRQIGTSWQGVPVGTGKTRLATIRKDLQSINASTQLQIIEGDVFTNFVIKPQFFDLTQMFGSTIADYIYSLEQSQAGAGVAWFKKLFPNDYYEYNAGELLSVGGLSAHVMRDADNNIIGNYPLDSSLTLRGVPKLDASNNLYYDGDEYESDGIVNRRFRIDTYDGSEAWEKDTDLSVGGTTIHKFYLRNDDMKKYTDYVGKMLANKCETTNTYMHAPSMAGDFAVTGYSITSNNYNWMYIFSKTVDTVEGIKAWLVEKPLQVLYELATPTTETAQAYTNLQVVDPDGTEEFVSTGILPVGHNSTYLLVCPISVCDNVSVSAKGKNLFDINKIVPNNMSVENGELHLANASGGNDNIQNGQKLSDLANLEVGETYTLSANSTYSNKVIYLNTSEKGWAFGTSTVITQEDLDSRIGWYGNGAIISNIQIELGSTATDYEPYQAKTATLSDIVLRSTPDGTRDRLFKDTDGLWKVESNCAYISSYNGESITTSYYSNTGELSTGASVVYALEAPTYEILPDSIQAELNALTTYNPVTNVMVSDGVTPDIDVSFWTRDYYAKNAAENAAKVATNFMEYDSTNGLIVGNKTSGSWSGYRSQILPGSFNVLDASSTVLASFGPTTTIGEEAKANLYLTFNSFSMVDKDGVKLFEVGDNRNAEGIATIKHTAMVVANSTGSATVTVDTYILSIISVYADSVQLSSSSYSFSQKDVTINNLTANSQTSIEITYTTDDPSPYLTFGKRDSSGKIGRYSVAEGQRIIASGECSHAEGSHTEAIGIDSHAEGNGTNATGRCSHAEGILSTASGEDSHAEGYYTKASGEDSHAEGYSTKASGEYSHAEGRYSEASGKGSHAGGCWTVADGDYMTAIGQYNTKNSGKAFVIGNGTSDTARSDAFTVDWSGNIYMSLGGCTITNSGTALSVTNGASTLDGLLAQSIINTFSYADAKEILEDSNINTKKLLQKIVEKIR